MELGMATTDPQPELTDCVVRLTPFLDEDAPMMVEWNHDPDIARWFDFAPLPSDSEHLEHVRRVIACWHDDYVAGSRIPWAVRDADTGHLLGQVELRPSTDGGAAAPYTTHPLHRGQGIPTRALRLACAWGFEQG